MKDVKDFDDVRWDDGKPTVTDYVWGRDNQTASLIRAYKDEIERLRAIIDLQADEMARLNKDVEFLEGQVERLQDMLWEKE